MANLSRALLAADRGKARHEYIKTAEGAQVGREKAQGKRRFAQTLGKGIGFLAGSLIGGPIAPLLYAGGGALFGGISDIRNKAEDLKVSGGKYQHLVQGQVDSMNRALKRFDKQENQAFAIDTLKDLAQGYMLHKQGIFDRAGEAIKSKVSESGLAEQIGQKLDMKAKTKGVSNRFGPDMGYLNEVSDAGEMKALQDDIMRKSRPRLSVSSATEDIGDAVSAPLLSGKDIADYERLSRLETQKLSSRVHRLERGGEWTIEELFGPEQGLRPGRKLDLNMEWMYK